jgi:hypothetical protein
MRQAVMTSSICLSLSLVVAATATAFGGGTDASSAIAQARRLIEAKDHAAAMALLEDALLDADKKQKPAIVDLLKTTYEALAQKAESAGRKREAAHYRDNLAIIDRSRTAGPPKKPDTTPPLPKPSTERRPAPKKDVDIASTVVPRAQPATSVPLESAPIASPPIDQEPPPAPQPAKVAALEPRPKPPAKVAAPQADSTPTLEDADRLYRAERYVEAGLAYTALARQNRLPANRAPHWVYCRCKEVARRINLHPRSAREWDEIEAEVASIQKLAPNIWLGEYLRNKVAEARRDNGRTAAGSNGLVVRGSAPDESANQPRRFPRLFGKSRTDAVPAKQPADAADGEVPLKLAAAPGRSSGGGLVDTETVQDAADSATDRRLKWDVYDTASFRIFHRDARLAQQAGEVAETARIAQARRWGSKTAERPWAPRCELYLYPSGKALAQATGQPEDSPGFSTMQSNGQRIIARRTNLRADHPQLLTAILPHEVTHVVLADLFTLQQIPRWADEGMAVLAEPPDEQERRIAELDEPLRAGRLFDVGKLMGMDYPHANDWALYYAQSVSLTRFLVDQGTPEQFVQFVRDLHARGIEPALRSCYRISGFAELEERWLEHARARTSPIKAAQRDADPQLPTAAER